MRSQDEGVFYHVRDHSGNLVAEDSREDIVLAGHGAPPGYEAGPLPPVPSGLADKIEFAFAGPQGVRWFWRLLAYFAMRQALYFLLGDAVLYARDAKVSYLWVMFIAESVFMVAAMVPAFVLARLEHRPFGAYGLPPRLAFGKLFWAGVTWGMAAITLLVVAMHFAGVFDFGEIVLHGTRLVKFAIFWGAFFLIVAFAEDFFFRGYPQFTLTQGIGFWPAALVLSIAFSILHMNNPGESPLGLVAVGAIGLFFCLTLRRTGSLWFAVGFHAAWDWGETYLYSVPDSGTVAPGHLLKSSFHGPAWLTGGSVGPEGSVLLFILVALLWVAFDRVYPHVAANAAAPTPHVGAGGLARPIPAQPGGE
jgi:membrane protease YdiL (CAAX protease family)